MSPQTNAASTGNVPRRISWLRMSLRWGWRGACLLCILFTLSHVVDVLYYWSGTSLTDQISQEEPSLEQVFELPPSRLRLAAIVTEILKEDGLVNAEIWALAIARHVPTDDLGYAALVIAQIRRESHFNAPDLEWLYDQIVPDVLHQAGLVRNPINTVGPMQINRHQLLRLMRQYNEKVEVAEGPAFSKVVTDIDLGVRYAIVYLDEVIYDYIPSREIFGWSDFVGRMGFLQDNVVNQAPAEDPAAFYLRETVAVYQKMLSDLLSDPLVLDGVLGPRTLKAARAHAMRLSQEEKTRVLTALEASYAGLDTGEKMQANDSYILVSESWQQVYGIMPTLSIYPRISHDPRLIYVLADFNIGKGTCRVAALQHMLNALHSMGLEVDGQLGVSTLKGIRSYIEQATMADSRKKDFLELIDQKKKLKWVRAEVSALINKEWQEQLGGRAPTALCPQLYTNYLNQQHQSIKRLSTRDYVSGSVWFFENYYLRLQRKEALRRSFQADAIADLIHNPPTNDEAP